MLEIKCSSILFVCCYLFINVSSALRPVAFSGSWPIAVAINTQPQQPANDVVFMHR